MLSTLLFLGAVGLQRPWDLRGYSGDGLALLTERSQAYGYVHTERFLAQVAQADGDQTLTAAVTCWSAQLWGVDEQTLYYVDMHRKPVYAEVRLPRGLIGRTGKVLGCRGLALLNDEAGHPLLAITDRGDTHLTQAFPRLMESYHQAMAKQFIQMVVLDREGMGAEFLHSLAGVCEVTTLLRSNQYQGEASFIDVGPFSPLTVDEEGNVIREVAAARFELKLPGETEKAISLTVALLRDWSRLTLSDEPVEVTPASWEEPRWWEEGYVATPLPTPAKAPKLIPIVSTAESVDVVDLVADYKRRWPAQENIIRDFLIPLGWETNHGYAKTVVENSEVAKRRQAWQTHIDNVRRWRANALVKSDQAGKLYRRRWQKAKEHGDELYRQLNQEQSELELADIPWYQVKRQIKEKQVIIDAELEQMWTKAHKAYHNSNREWEKARNYVLKERQLLRQLADLDSQEKRMYELDNRKDQIMTILRVALTNLIMWTRDQFFSQAYAKATWKRLAPFFRLPGLVIDEADRCLVYLRPFNDSQLNRDLDALCHRVNATQPCLPDGRYLQFVRHKFAPQITDMPP
jgi:hypothetical protein